MRRRIGASKSVCACCTERELMFVCISTTFMHSNEDDDDDEEGVGLGDAALEKWKHRQAKLDHDCAITAWALSVMPEVREDCKKRINGNHRNAIERVVERLHVVPCPNEKVKGMSTTDTLDLFWKEHKAFSKQDALFNKTGRWLTKDALQGNSHLWHENCSLPCTKVLGHVGCRTTSKNLGMGLAKRGWGDTKQIKDGKRSGLGAKSIEKRSILFTAAKIADARAMRVEREKGNADGENDMFGDDDMKQVQMLLFDFLHDFYCVCNFYCICDFNCVCYFCCVYNTALTLS